MTPSGTLPKLLEQAKATLELHQQIRQMFADETMQMFDNRQAIPRQTSVEQYDQYIEADRKLIDTIESMLNEGQA